MSSSGWDAPGTYPPPGPYPGDPYAPGSGPYAGTPYPGAVYPGYPAERPRSLRGLGIASQVLLAVQALGCLLLIAAMVHQRAGVEQIANDPGSITLAQATHDDNLVSEANALTLVLLLATGVVFIIWFFRARRNVESWQPVFQRRGVGWAIGGWFCPVVSLWFPYLIASDIINDTERAPGDFTVWRRPVPLVIAWWLVFAGWDVIFAVVALLPYDHGNLASIANHIDIEIFGESMRIVAAVLAILVVGRITSAQSRRMQLV